MKLITLFPAFLLMAAPAANAVDYVKCEAMNKTAVRLRLTRDREAQAAGIRVREVLHAAECAELKGDTNAWLECADRTGYEEALEASQAVKADYSERLAKIQADYQAAGCP